MGIWAFLADLGLWPPDRYLAFAVVTGLVLGFALREARDFAILGVLTLLLMFPVKWFGTALGLQHFAQDVLAWPFPQAGGWQFPLRPAPAVFGAVLLAAVAMIAWKRIAPREADAEAAAQMSRSRNLLAVSQTLLAMLTAFIHLATIFLVPASVPGLVATFLLPGIAQVYWLWVLWPAASPLTQMCLVWLCLFAIWLLACWMLRGRREPVRS